MTEGAVAAVKPYGLEWEEACAQKLYKPLGMTSTSSRYADFIARENKALGHVLVNGKWEQKFKRDPDAQSPTGGVSSPVNDVAKWIRLDSPMENLMASRSLAKSRWPKPSSAHATGFNPFTNMPSFYGLGWNVSYDQQGRLRLNHSGGFDLGAAAYVNLIPAEQLGIVVLTNGHPWAYGKL